MSVDCLLIYPFLEEANWKNELRSKDNLALGYLASCAREAGFTVKIVHAEHLKYDADDIVRIVCECQPKAIGISCTAQRAYPIAKKYAYKIKEKTSVPIFMGGVFPTIAYEAIFNDCDCFDAISLGEGEIFIVEYLNHIIKDAPKDTIKGIVYKDEKGSLIVNPQTNIIDLDTLPLPAKDFFDDMKEELENGFYYINISASRGCYANCSFCSLKHLTSAIKKRTRNPRKVVEEIKYFQNKYNVTYFKFVDEQFIDIFHPEWVIEFCDEMKKQDVHVKFHIEARVDSIKENLIKPLKDVGLDEVFIGLESGDIGILKRYRKGHNPKQAEEAVKLLRKYNINVQYGYIMIDAGMTFDQLKNNISWILKLGGYSKHNLYNKLNLYYGTDLYKENIQNANDDMPFYSRDFHGFVDQKVERFSSLIDIAKKTVTEYNTNVNSYLLKLIKNKNTANKWKSIAADINSFEVIIWESIILKALLFVESFDEFELDIWHTYLQEQVHILSRNLKSVQEGELAC